MLGCTALSGFDRHSGSGVECNTLAGKILIGEHGNAAVVEGLGLWCLWNSRNRPSIFRFDSLLRGQFLNLFECCIWRKGILRFGFERCRLDASLTFKLRHDLRGFGRDSEPSCDAIGCGCAVSLAQIQQGQIHLSALMLRINLNSMIQVA